MSYCYSGTAPEDQEESPAYLNMCSKASMHSEGDQRQETEEERWDRETNEKLRSSTNSTDFNPHHPYTSCSSRKPSPKIPDALESLGHELKQTDALPSVVNPKQLKAEASKPFPWRTCSTMVTKKKLNDMAHAREVHRKKFQATLDLLMEEFESGAIAARIQIPQIQEKTLDTETPLMVQVNFSVHYNTHSTSKLLAVTGNIQELGAWDGFVLLQNVEDELWTNTITLSSGSVVEWKFVVVEDCKIKRWEEGRNRQLLIPSKGEEVQLLCKWAWP